MKSLASNDTYRRTTKRVITERPSPRKVLKVDNLLSALELDGGLPRAIEAVGDELNLVVAALKAGGDGNLLALEDVLDRLHVRVDCIADLAKADERVFEEQRRELVEAGGFPNLRIALAYAQNATTKRYSREVVALARAGRQVDRESPAAWTKVLDEILARPLRAVVGANEVGHAED